MVAPLRIDPTRTKTLRNKFERAMLRRFKLFAESLQELVVDLDVFGLGREEKTIHELFFNVAAGSTQLGLYLPPGDLVTNVTEGEWAFLSDDRKLEEFERWVQEETDLVITSEGDRFWEDFVEQGYERGVNRAFTDTTKGVRAAATLSGEGTAAQVIEGTRAGFTASTLGAPETAEKVRLLASRVLTDLKNVNTAMATQMGRVLVDGLVRRDNPNRVASEMATSLGIARNRARTIARTELIRAHAEGQLDALERLGVTEIGVMVEWSIAATACPLCVEMDGVVLKVSEAHGLIPRHPNCRCAFIPANVGESRRGQTWTGIQSRINRSLKEEGGKKRTLRESKQRSTWPGKRLRVSRRRRPRGVVT